MFLLSFSSIAQFLEHYTYARYFKKLIFKEHTCVLFVQNLQLQKTYLNSYCDQLMIHSFDVITVLITGPNISITTSHAPITALNTTMML